MLVSLIDSIDLRENVARTPRKARPGTLTPSRTTLGVEAVAGDESIVSAGVGRAKPKPPGVRVRMGKYAVFQPDIQKPGTFDHLHQH